MELSQRYRDNKKTMKMNIMGVLAFALVLGCGATIAKDEAGVIALKETLSKVPAAEVPPKAAKEILAGLSEALPALKEPIAEAVAFYKGQPLAVAPVIDRIAASDVSGAPLRVAPPPLRGPTIGGPYVPYSGTATNVPPNGGNVPVGGRDYAAP